MWVADCATCVVIAGCAICIVVVGCIICIDGGGAAVVRLTWAGIPARAAQPARSLGAATVPMLTTELYHRLSQLRLRVIIAIENRGWVLYHLRLNNE